MSVAAIKPVPRRKKIHAAAEIPISAQAAINADIAEFLPYPTRRVKKYCRRHSTRKHFKHRMSKTCDSPQPRRSENRLQNAPTSQPAYKRKTNDMNTPHFPRENEAQTVQTHSIVFPRQLCKGGTNNMITHSTSKNDVAEAKRPTRKRSGRRL